jgi:hypothetical protein
MTLAKILAYPSQPDYISDVQRTRKQPTRVWEYGRIRHFCECLLSGEELDAIEVDNECNFGHIYPVPVLLDGHHRLAASHLTGASIIFVSYGGRLDLLRYLTGGRKTRPAT